MNIKIIKINIWGGDFPGGLVVKTSSSNAGVLVLSLFEELSKIPHALWPKKKKNTKKKTQNRSNIVTNSIKTLKNSRYKINL